MVHVIQTLDLDYVADTLESPDVLPFVVDDSSPAMSHEQIVEGFHRIGGLFLAVLRGTERVGAFWFRLTEPATYEAHTMLLRSCRGRDAVEAGKAAIAWVFAHTDCTRIISHAFSDSPAVSWFCRKVGLTQYDRTKHSATRGGREVDFIRYHLLKGTA